MTINEISFSWTKLPLSIPYLLLAVEERKFDLIFAGKENCLEFLVNLYD